MKRERDDVLFVLGLGLWVAILALTWPRALSFGDEVGYVARAKLLLEGHLGYVANSLGIWLPTPHGPVGKYPLLFSLLVAPLLAIAPGATFALSVGATVVLAWTARSIMKAWGKSPLWALLVLAHPTIVILARTVMADVPQATAAVAAWWALKRGRAAATVAWLVLLVALKATGPVLAFGLVAGEAISSQRALRARDAATWRRLAWGAVGGVLGFVLLVALNELATGKAWFAYDHSMLSTPPFWLGYLPERAPVHAMTLLLEPPLLIAGAWSYWRRRELGPLLLCGGFLALMCVYFFVDTGASRVESIVLSPRLILPVVAFLLIGYGAWLDDVVARLVKGGADGARGTRGAVAAALVVIPLVVTAGVSLRHARFQHAMGAIRTIASERARADAGNTLGVTENACKAGVLHDGPTTLFDPKSNATTVVFCSVQSASHRADQGTYSCALPGYRTVAEAGGFYALERDGVGPGSP
jgi:hypothetical protein